MINLNAVQRGPNKRKIKPAENNELLALALGVDEESDDDEDFEVHSEDDEGEILFKIFTAKTERLFFHFASKVLYYMTATLEFSYLNTLKYCMYRLNNINPFPPRGSPLTSKIV